MSQRGGTFVHKRDQAGQFILAHDDKPPRFQFAMIGRAGGGGENAFNLITVRDGRAKCFGGTGSAGQKKIQRLFIRCGHNVPLFILFVMSVALL